MRHVFSILIVLTLLAPRLAQAQEPALNADRVTLRPGDVVRVMIWREDDLSGEFAVNENGMVTLPLLGEKQASGIEMQQLRGTLIDEYRIHLRNPSITITPLRRINVLGEVNRPGLYEVDPTITLAGAVALAGGTNPQGDLDQIRIVRQGEVIRERVAASSSLQVVDIRSGDQIFVGRRGWFDRHSTFVVSVLLSVTSILISLRR
jgi:polysaccharide biosynthesis/export protein